MSAADLRALLSPAALLALAGERSFQRGATYFREKRVGSLVEVDGGVSAKVEGTSVYHVRLWPAGATLGHDCNCPVGLDLRFCKHCVAVALAWTGADPSPLEPVLVRRPVEQTAPAAAVVRRRPDPEDEVPAYLERQSKEELLALVLEAAAGSPKLRTRLRLRALTAGDDSVNPKRLRSLIDTAFRTRDFVDYHRAPAYARQILEVIGELRGLLESDASALVVLVEHAVARAERAIQDVDDSDGWFTEIFAVLGDLHLEACERARPDPVKLAARLFERALRDDYDVFHPVGAYAAVLGASGLEEYRAGAEREWARIPALGPGDRAGLDRFQITRMMEEVARETGDVDALVEVMRRDLSAPYQFLKIAEVYHKAGNRAEAREWVEAGLAAFPRDGDDRLRRFLADICHEEGRHDEAMELVWAAFDDHPGLGGFMLLREHAERAKAWPGAWRERALARVRAQADREPRQSSRSFAWHHEGFSEVVRIHLWEGRVDEAWAAAGEGGCTEELWFELARRREGNHPADAIPIYERRIEAKVAGGGNDAYDDAVRLLVRLADLHRRAAAEPERYPAFVGRLRQEYRRKRNFIARLDAARLG